MPDLPLDERALLAAREAAYDACDVSAITPEALCAAISTYLREARFEVAGRFEPQAQRLTGPWLPVNKQEGE